MSSIAGHFGEFVDATDNTDYSDLFSPDSDDVDMDNDDSGQYLNTGEMQGHVGIRILNIKEKLRELDLLHDMKGDTIYDKDESSDMSISSGGSMVFIEEDSECFANVVHCREYVPATPTAEKSLPIPLTEEECDDLLRDDSLDIVQRHNSALQETIDNEEDEHMHEDIIGTFNVQNKYDHSLAAQLFLEGQFSLLCLQEPHASHTKIQDSWKSCRRLELDSARITCHETHHQVLLYDAWKWGGKIISNFSSQLNGRIVGIAFQFGNGEQLGILSVYAVARGGGTSEEKIQRDKLRCTTVTLVKKQHRKWLKQFPKIKIMIMGDMQETISVTDMDNMGKSRFSNDSNNGIVQAFRKTHISLAKNRNAHVPYLTRIGREGARGIDHILFPDNPKAQALIKHAMVHEYLGSNFFPSDHKLITCTYFREDSNNAESMPETIKYEFNKISQIKLQRKIVKGEHVLSIDDSQFSGSSIFIAQQNIYKKLQEVTGDESSSSDFHLNDLEKRIQLLYNSLWKLSCSQNCEGNENKLVSITDYQAAELSYIVKAYDHAIKDTMTFMHLTKETNCLSNKALIRNNIRLKEDFKLFENLPISTKLRYTRCNIQRKRKALLSYINFIKNQATKDKFGYAQSLDLHQIFHNWKKITNAKHITKKATDVYSAYTKEAEERQNHMEAIRYTTSRGKGKSQVVNTNAQTFFQKLPPKTIRLINVWLSESKCQQGFNITPTTDRFSFLNDKSTSWKEPLDNLHSTISKSWFTDAEKANLLNGFQKAVDALKKVEGKISTAQRAYKADTIHYLLQVNKIEDFTRKINPKKRDAPATHTEIWDKGLQQFRTCRNEKEELLATGNFHGQWMGNSKAEESCAFAKIMHKGRLGARGVSLDPDRKVGLSDIPKLIKDGGKLPWSIKQAFIKAHGKHTSDLFRAPSTPHKALFYPFFLSSGNGEMNKEKDFKESFWNAITLVPGKARLEGFHLAVVGRFGRRWQQCLYDMSKLILIMRYIPRKLKAIARFPIPKPGRVNEYRPISLCHDLYCFINAISTLHTSRGIEEAKILHEGITAYVKGKGCTTLVGVEQAVREDCVESGVPTSQTDEDEEKFFDRIPVEILLAAMKVNGFPDQGFLELKASGMEAKSVQIITAKGIAHARFVCGLEQGNPDSPTISNLVIKFKHDIWKHILNETEPINRNDLETNGTDTKNRDAYRFHIFDPRDGPILVDRIGYCDDNTRYTSSYDENAVLDATRKYIQRAGDLSLVTKIGRKGSKSEIHYFNLKAETALKIDKIESLAWSFAIDAPKLEQVPFKISLQPSELSKLYQILDFNNLDKEAQEEILNIFQSKPHKHLGLTSTLQGVTTSASREVMLKIKDRLQKLNLYNMEKEAQQRAANLLCSTVHSYATLQMGHDHKDLEECDKLLIQQISKKHGLSLSDAKHPLFINEDKGGYGFRSFLDIDLIATIRELEIVLNSFMIDSRVSRSRLRAYAIRTEIQDYRATLNFIGNAVKKIARYGFHIRDKYDGVVNYIFYELNKQRRYIPIGYHNYSGLDGFSMGYGKERSLDIAYGGTAHATLKRALNSHTSEWNPAFDMSNDLDIPISLPRLRRLAKSEKLRHFKDRCILFNFWEWSSDRYGKADYRDKASWKYVNVMQRIEKRFPNSYWMMTSEDIFEKAMDISQECIRDAGALKIIERLQCTAVIATDGSHNNDNRDTNKGHAVTHITSSAAVVCVPTLDTTENWEDGQWQHRQAIPIYARAAVLPKKFGVHNSDIGHGEGVAVCQALDILVLLRSSVLVMDSKSLREVATNIRDRPDRTKIDRKLIRTIISGVSKHIGSRMNCTFEFLEKKQVQPEDAWKSQNKLQFMKLCKKWTESEKNEVGNTADIGLPWKAEYWDSNMTIPILKVDSHQLNNEGTAIKNKPRYPMLSPNLFLLSCNHHADVCADLIQQVEFETPHINEEIILPESMLRFSITWGGKGIDKHVSEFVQNVIQEERLNRLKRKRTQGLPWRIIKTKAAWNEIKNMKKLMQSLKGFTRTHSRSIYKSLSYRECCIERRINKRDGSSGKELHQKSFSKKQWTQVLTTCTWCANHNQVKGNRYHAILFCDHSDLCSFRRKTSQLLESKLFNFLKIITNTQGEQECEFFLQQIEQTIATLHNLESFPASERHTRYRTRKEWMVEEGVQSWQDILNSAIPIFSHIFGFEPVMELQLESDLEMNEAICIAIGVIPRELDNKITAMAKGIIKFYSDKVFCDATIATYHNLWREIKEILWAKIMGSHSIIGDISRKMEADFEERKKSTAAMTPTVVRQIPKPKSILRPTTIHSASIHQSRTANRKRKRVKFEPKMESRKKCQGTTCNHNINPSKFVGRMPSTIHYRKKQCQRCSRQHTAFRKGIAVLQDIENRKSPSEISNIIQHFDTTANDIQYKESVKHLKSPQKTCDLTSSCKTGKLSDAQKTIIKTISTSISRNTNRNNNPEQRLQEAISNLKQEDTTTNKFLQIDLRRSIHDVDHVIPKPESEIQKKTKLLNFQGEVQQVKEKIWMSTKEKQLICEDQKQTLERGMYMSARALNRAITNIRLTAPENVYVAAPSASTIIASLPADRTSWEDFAVLFRSVNVSNKKPDGTYLIPIFSGEDAQGHWSFIAINKQYGSRRLWVMDSLGCGNTESPIIGKIKKLFSSAKLRCRIVAKECKPQTEVECGPRTVLGMVSISEALEKGKTIEEAITIGSLLTPGMTAYDPREIRSKAAKWVREDETSRTKYEKAESIFRKYLKKRRRKRKTGGSNMGAVKRGRTEEIVID